MADNVVYRIPLFKCKNFSRIKFVVPINIQCKPSNMIVPFEIVITIFELDLIHLHR